MMFEHRETCQARLSRLQVLDLARTVGLYSQNHAEPARLLQDGAEIARNQTVKL